MEKSRLRKEVLEVRNALSEEEVRARSAVVIDRVLEIERYKKADVVFAYMSFGTEIMTDGFIARALSDGKRVAVPRTARPAASLGGSEYMEFVFIDEKTKFETRHGIREPAAGEIAEEDAFVLVPGVVFGRDMSRIGYGGGFYDRYFASRGERDFFKVGVCYGFQLISGIRSEAHDIKMDLILHD